VGQPEQDERAQDAFIKMMMHMETNFPMYASCRPTSTRDVEAGFTFFLSRGTTTCVESQAC